MTPEKEHALTMIPVTSVVKVGHGRGFIVQNWSSKSNNWRRVPRRLIVTAAHCLETLPVAHAAGDTHERIVKMLGNLKDKEPSVFAEILFADPIRDIAVLGAPDGQEFPEGEEAYENLTENAAHIKIGRIHPRHKTGWILSLDGRWIPTSLNLHQYIWGQSLSTGPVDGGMSGSPILNKAGEAVAVVAVGSNSDFHGPQPILTDVLPGWLTRTIP